MLRARLFGGLALAWHQEPLPVISSHVARSLLAYLIIHRDRSHTRDLLAGSFWPNLPPPTPVPTVPPPPTAVPTPADTTAPPAPVLLKPLDGSTVDPYATIVLRWSPVSDPSGIAEYLVRVERHIGDANWEALEDSPWRGLTAPELELETEPAWTYRARAGCGRGWKPWPLL